MNDYKDQILRTISDPNTQDRQVLREWIEQTVINGAVIREEQIRLTVRNRPRWLPDRLWRWSLSKLLVIEVSS